MRSNQFSNLQEPSIRVSTNLQEPQIRVPTNLQERKNVHISNRFEHAKEIWVAPLLNY